MGLNLNKLIRHEKLSRGIKEQLNNKRKYLVAKLKIVNELLDRPTLPEDKVRKD